MFASGRTWSAGGQNLAAEDTLMLDRRGTTRNVVFK